MSEQRIPNQPKLNSEALLKIINRSQTVINGLNGNDAWAIVLEDFGNQCKNLDSNWQFVNDEKKMYEFKITKIAAMSVVNLVDNYKFNLQQATQALKETVDHKNNIEKDTDNEGVESGEEN